MVHKNSGLQLQQVFFTVRTVQGYRFLDRAGDFLAKAEDALGGGWITGEARPTGAILKNDALQFSARVDSELITVQGGYYPEWDTFLDAAATFTEIAIRTFDIKQVLAPVTRFVWQHPTSSVEETERFLQAAGFVQIMPRVTDAFGEPTTVHLTYTSESNVCWRGFDVQQRVRFVSRGVQQLSQRLFDDRLLKRVKIMPKRQQEAMKVLLQLRSEQQEPSLHAAELDMEHSLEGEFPTAKFDVAGFIEDSFKFLDKATTKVMKGQ